MDKSTRSITKQYLETLSFEALVVLADECGVDVPKDLDRSFLIADLLEAAEEDEDDNMIAVYSETETPNVKLLDSSYALGSPCNMEASHTFESMIKKIEEPGKDKKKHSAQDNDEYTDDSEDSANGFCTPTDVALVASGPLWALVYWNVGGRDALGNPSVFLRINSFDDKNNTANGERFVLSVDSTETWRYVLLPRAHKYVQIDLLTVDENDWAHCMSEDYALTSCPLTSSAIYELEAPSNLLLSDDAHISEIQELSGTRELVSAHYKSYRHSLSATSLQF